MADPNNPKSVKVTTPRFRLSFPHLDKPHAMQGQDLKFSLVMLFPKNADMGWAKQAILKVMTERWGDKVNWPKGWKNPIRDGDQKESPVAGYEGNYYMTARSKERPGCVDQQVQDILDVKDVLYAGCYARATIAFYWYDRSGNKGVGVALNNVQKMGDGEKFSGKADAKKDFDATADDGESGTDDLLDG